MSNNIVDFTGNTVLPISGPKMLRRLADTIDAGGDVQTIVIILEGKPTGLDIASTHADMERTMSITQAGLDKMREQYSHNINTIGRRK